MPSDSESGTIQIYFSDFFDVSPEALEEYGAFDVSLINDMPLFVDPFLLFHSAKPEYQQLHDEMIEYLRFLRDKANAGGMTPGLLKAWYQFKEIRQNWLGFSLVGNRGSALGPRFAVALNENLDSIFRSFGDETVTKGSHLEKVCLISPGVGRDNISDFTTSLIKSYLLEYTQQFAQTFLPKRQRGIFSVPRTRFNYETEAWQTERFELPRFNGDFVLLTPMDMLTRDEVWISRDDLYRNFDHIAASVPDDQLRSQLSHYLYTQLLDEGNATKKEREEKRRRAIDGAIRTHPEIIEFYIKDKEDTGDQASAVSSEKVAETALWFVDEVREFVATQLAGTQFYEELGSTFESARRRLLYLKHIIEDKDGYRLFYHGGKPIQRESDLQLLFKFTWYGSPHDVNSEVNNGRGPADFAVSMGSRDKSLVEFKLAKNTQLKRNLENQLAIYQAAADAQRSLTAICYFTESELARVQGILRELQLDQDDSIVLIDARADNKPSASRA